MTRSAVTASRALLRRRRVARVVAIAAAVTSLMAPAGAMESTDVTGDVTEPAVASLTVSPGGADVTQADASFSVSTRLTDDWSGVNEVHLSWLSVDGSHAHEVGLTLASGDERDGLWTGVFSIPRLSAAGRYELAISVADRVRNGRFYDSDALAAQGFASGVDITSSDPDVTAPRITGLRAMATTVDVRQGPAVLDFEVTVSDNQSGVSYGSVYVRPPDPNIGDGGVEFAYMWLTSGDRHAGGWTGTMRIPRFVRSGRWRLGASFVDAMGNHRRLEGDDLAAATGGPGWLDVISHDDLDAPRILSVNVEPWAVNVHDADQTVRVSVRVADSPAGVRPISAGAPWWLVGVDVFDPVTGQNGGLSAMSRTSGDSYDGVYEWSFTVPRSSATGLRRVGVSAQDTVGNWDVVAGEALVTMGGPPGLLVYNVPLPPVILGVDPGDGQVVVRFDPPPDDRGSPVTGYVVRESPGGAVVEVSADARVAVVGGLANGVSHTFTMVALNRAGASDASGAVSAIPQVGLPAPGTVSAGSGGALSDPPASDASGAPVAATRSGYWMVESAGRVHAFGDAPWLGHAPAGPSPAVDLEPTPSRGGYWVVDADGRVYPFGDARPLGDAPVGSRGLAAGETVTSLSATPSGRGYWVFTTRGRVLAFGDAPFLGDMSAVKLNQPVLDSVPTPSGWGYYMVAGDGGVFAFGDARFAGSMAATKLNAPVQSLVPNPNGSGYWLVASDGGIFSFAAPFFGSMGAVPLNRPVTGMVGSPTGRGYLMVAEDGGIFTFGDVAFRGSLGARLPASRVTAAAAL